MVTQKIIIFSFLLIVTSSVNLVIGQNQNNPETNVIYGEKHIYTIETPNKWVNDKEFAQKIGLVCFFYPINEKHKNLKNYIFTRGLDKDDSLNETFSDFVDKDIKQFREKYPELTFEKTILEFNGGVKNGVLYSYSNLSDRYKEEIIYAETDDAFLLFSFVAMTSEDYTKFQPIFNNFIASFKYRGNNPKPFLDYMRNKSK